MFRSTAIVFLAVACIGCGGGGPLAPQVAQPVDLLSFVLGPDGSRHGSQLQSQLVSWPKREVSFIKYGRHEMFETWRWDEQFVYHAVDHALDGETGGSYHFTDGRWLPRHLPENTRWSLDLPDNRIREYDRACLFLGERPFPYKLEAFWLGQELTLSYTPYDPISGLSGGGTEWYTFRRGAGWIRWASPRGVATFEETGGPSMTWHTAPCP